MKNKSVRIFAGPCSVDFSNIGEIYQIAKMEVGTTKKKAIFGTRIVGLKSRTAYSKSGAGMGIDYPILMENLRTLDRGGCVTDLRTPPSALLSLELVRKTGMHVATEVMMPHVQLPPLAHPLTQGKLMPWNPSVEQLGWSVAQMAVMAARHGWTIGLKNGKWVGSGIYEAEFSQTPKTTSLEKTWAGLATFAAQAPQSVLIHRGVDVPEKGDHRNLPVHNIATRVKQATGCKLFLDPSHMYGPKLRNLIVPETIKALKMKVSPTEFLYEGVLIEVGTSQTDTDQHISIPELQGLVDEVATFRTLEVDRAMPKLMSTPQFQDSPEFLSLWHEVQ